MTQPWVLDLFLNCDESGVSGWEGGPIPANRPVLHCPNASTVEKVKEAVRNVLAFKHDDPDVVCDRDTYTFIPLRMMVKRRTIQILRCLKLVFIELCLPSSDPGCTGLEIAERLADQLGVSRPMAVSQRDVPGWTRCTTEPRPYQSAYT